MINKLKYSFKNLRSILFCIAFLAPSLYAEITAKIVDSETQYNFDNSDYNFLQQTTTLKIRQESMLSEMRIGLLANTYSHDKEANGLYKFYSNSGGLNLGTSLLLHEAFLLNTDLGTWWSNNEVNYKLNGSLEWTYPIDQRTNQKLKSTLESEISRGYGSPLKRKLSVQSKNISLKVGAEMNYWDGMIGVMKIYIDPISLNSTSLVLINDKSAKQFDANESTIAYAYAYAKLFEKKLLLGLSAKTQNSLYSTNYYYQEIDPNTALISTVDYGNFPYYSPVNAKSLSMLIGNSIDLSRWPSLPLTSIKTQLLIPLYSEEDYKWEAPYAESLENITVQNGFYKAKGTAALELKIDIAKQISEQFWISGTGTTKIKPYSDNQYFVEAAYQSYEFLINLNYWW